MCRTPQVFEWTQKWRKESGANFGLLRLDHVAEMKPIFLPTLDPFLLNHYFDSQNTIFLLFYACAYRDCPWDDR